MSKPHSATLLVRLIDDLVMSEVAVTAGVPRSLRYIPGSALLGLSASSLYAKLGANAFDVFHSGKVRFLNGYPAIDAGLNDGSRYPTWPMPASIHWVKDDAARDSFNLAVAIPEDGVQYQQARSDFLGPSGKSHQVNMRSALKTAVDQKRGRAADAQLFGFEAISAGQTFIAGIEADASVSEPHFLAVVASLVDRRCLGRSRNSEFGTVDIQQVDCNIDTAMGSSDEDGKGTTLWALSDLFLVDANGQPVLDPEQADIGLSGVKIDWSRTFIRTRTYTPYNGTWRSRGPARSLISLGSVITFSEQLTEEDKKALAKGIGVHRELGYGHVWVDPPVLAESRLGAFAAPLIGAQAPPPPLKQVENKLLNWMKKRTEGRVGATAAIEKSRELADALFSANGYYDRAVAFQGRKRQLVAAPGRTQWNEVATIAGRAHGTIDLVTKLFAEQSSPCRDRQSNEPSDEFWDARYDAAANKTFRDALKAFIAEAKADSAPLVIATLAKAAAERVDRWRVGQ